MQKLESRVDESAVSVSFYPTAKAARQREDFGYLVTVPFYAGEQVELKALIEKFAEEAFDNITETSLATKMAMIIGVNQQSTSALQPIYPPDDFQAPFPVYILNFKWNKFPDDSDKTPMGDICNFINKTQHAQTLIAKLRKLCRHIYYAKFDADTVLLNQCFSTYEAALRQHLIEGRPQPHIITSAYVTQHDNPGEAMLELGVLADYWCRIAVAQHLPFSPYVTEANVLIYLPETDDILQENYSLTCEMSGMITEIINQRNLDPYEAVAFVGGNPIVTEYRPALVNNIQFKAKFQSGHCVDWSIPELWKLHRIWQTHYTDNQKRQSDLQNILPNILGLNSGYTNRAYRKVGKSIEFVVYNIYAIFDPLIIAKQHSALFAAYEQDNLQGIQAMHVDILKFVLLSHRMHRGLFGTIHRTEFPKNKLLHDLGLEYTLEKLTEKLMWLLAMYVAYARNEHDPASVFTEEIIEPEYTYLTHIRKHNPSYYQANLQSMDATAVIHDGEHKIIRRKVVRYEDVLHQRPFGWPADAITATNNKIYRFVRSVVFAAKEQSISIAALFENALLFNKNAGIPFVLENFAAMNSSSDLIEENKNNAQWTTLQQHIFELNDPDDELESESDTDETDSEDDSSIVSEDSTADFNIPMSFMIELSSDSILETGLYRCNLLHVIAASTHNEYIELIVNYLRFIESQKPTINLTQLLDASMLGGPTPLEIAFRLDNARFASGLIDLGATLPMSLRHARTARGESLLHTVARHAEPDSINRVLRFIQCRTNEPKETKDLTDYCGQTPLHLLLQRQRIPLRAVRLLISDENMNIEDDDDNSPLSLVAGRSDTANITRFLILNGADPFTYHYNTPASVIEFAVAHNDTPQLRMIINKAKCVEQLGRGFIHNAISEISSWAMLSSIFDWYNKNTNIKKVLDSYDNQGNTPLHVAMFCGKYMTVDYLLRIGADTTLRTLAGLSAKNIAATRNNKVAIVILHYHELARKVQSSASLSPKIKHGLFKGKAPRNFRRITLRLNECHYPYIKVSKYARNELMALTRHHLPLHQLVVQYFSAIDMTRLNTPCREFTRHQAKQKKITEELNRKIWDIHAKRQAHIDLTSFQTFNQVDMAMQSMPAEAVEEQESTTLTTRLSNRNS